MDYTEILIKNLEYLDIISIVDEIVQALARIHWREDECPPEFYVSLNDEEEDAHSIMITVSHLGYNFTEKLFPRTNMQYGYDSLMSQMINLYNRTM
jgi:hypothetical protein